MKLTPGNGAKHSKGRAQPALILLRWNSKNSFFPPKLHLAEQI
jgi:hypothetical protein